MFELISTKKASVRRRRRRREFSYHFFIVINFDSIENCVVISGRERRGGGERAKKTKYKP